jgi:DnaA-homolog protein
MKQLALDIGLATAPSLASFFAGPNEAALSHLKLWTSGQTRAPVPTYLWGEAGCGKTHLLQAVHRALTEQGHAVGWLDAHTMDPPEFQDEWVAVLMDDVQLYNAEQQHTAFNWFVNALARPAGCWRQVLCRPRT